MQIKFADGLEETIEEHGRDLQIRETFLKELQILERCLKKGYGKRL